MGEGEGRGGSLRPHTDLRAEFVEDAAVLPGGVHGQVILAQLAGDIGTGRGVPPVSYTHLRAHGTVLELVCRLLLVKKKKKQLIAQDKT